MIVVASHCKYSDCYHLHFSAACAIELQDRVVVTGGVIPGSAIATVQVYTLSGPQDQLTFRHPDTATPALTTWTVRTEL